MSVGGIARAQSVPGFAVNRLEPSERGSDWFASESLDLRGKLRPALGVVGDYSYRSLVVSTPDGVVRAEPVRHLVFAHVGGSLVFRDRFRLSLDLPFQVFADGTTATIGTRTYLPPANAQGIGDLRLGADARLFGTYGDVVTVAVGAQVWLPTGDRDQYTSDGAVRIRPRVMVAGEVGHFVYAGQLNVGYRAHSETVDGSKVGTDLGLSASAGLRLAKRRLVVGPEIFGSTVPDDLFAKRTTPLEAILGAHYLLGGDVRVGAGVGAGLTSGFGAPRFRALLSAEWAPGAASTEKHARSEPTAASTDRDGDGVPDAEDACIDVRGVRSSSAKANGCPAEGDLDSDRDGIVDRLDACPNAVGLASTIAGSNGCAPDADGDGVNDMDDACPTTKGLVTSSPATNGCPDVDRDKDGIVNVDDACPDEPGPKDFDAHRNGCPKAFVRGGEIKILDQVKFKTGSAEIPADKESEDVLRAVLDLLNGHAEIRKVRVEGHTDDVGVAAANKKLSASRAASVVAWLVGHGIDAGRLSSAGFGSEKPVDSNETSGGRRNNRRVEFHVEP